MSAWQCVVFTCCCDVYIQSLCECQLPNISAFTSHVLRELKTENLTSAHGCREEDNVNSVTSFITMAAAHLPTVES